MQNCSETFRKIYNKTVLVAVTSSVQSWKLQITNNEIFVLISVLVFKLLSSKTLVINRKYNGLFQKKSQQRVLKTYSKKKNPPENFRFVSFVTLPLEVPEKQSFTPGTNTDTHGNPVLLLLDLPWKCQFFVIQPHPGIFKCYFSNNLGNSMSSTSHPPAPHPLLGFFLGIVQKKL